MRFGLLSDHLLGNSCPLGWPFVLILFCVFVALGISYFSFEGMICFLIAPVSVHCFLITFAIFRRMLHDEEERHGATLAFLMYVSVSAKEGSRGVGGSGPGLRVVDSFDSIITSSRIYLFMLQTENGSHTSVARQSCGCCATVSSILAAAWH